MRSSPFMVHGNRADAGWSVDSWDVEEWDVMATNNQGESVDAWFLHDRLHDTWLLDAFYD